mmetsp:Transcript_15690/g.19134  ORF Transcript_15690/g.19134 Transcript_15690/m.19134 type:complete len:410 (-) Transcript_15690:173-1402(-)
MKSSRASSPSSSSSYPPSRRALHYRLIATSTAAILLSHPATSFIIKSDSYSRLGGQTRPSQHPNIVPVVDSRPTSSTVLDVKWFGGGTEEDTSQGDELLAVKIERISRNSRRIAGEIIVSKSVDDVWAILTDYDNLATHVPNLVESRRVESASFNYGEQGDGKYKCRLYQKGAQKIVGFEFGASVTMDMTESIKMANVVPPRVLKLGREKKIQVNEQRRVSFKCVDSPFFSEFDGEWKVSWTDDPNDAFELATKVEYVVDVRPRGPVPVQALEWRIREDVPTNLRAVKAASIDLGLDGVIALREKINQPSIRTLKLTPSSNIKNEVSNPVNISATTGNSAEKNIKYSKLGGRRIVTVASSTRQSVGNLVATASKSAVTAANQQPKSKLGPVRVQWYEDETMATYLAKLE